MKKLFYGIISAVLFLLIVSGPVYATNTHSVILENGQYLSTPDTASLRITKDITIEGRLKPKVYADKTVYGILSKWDNGNKAYRVDYYKKTIRFLTSSDGLNTNVASVPCDLGINTSAHIKIIYHASLGKIEVFKNLIYQGEASGLHTTLFNGTADFNIGRADAGWDGDYWNGAFDDLRLWNVIRTLEETTNSYQKELLGTETGLMGYWKFNNNFLDSSPNNNHLTNNGGATFSIDISFISEATPETEPEVPEPEEPEVPVVTACPSTGDDIDTTYGEGLGAEPYQKLRLGVDVNGKITACIYEGISGTFIESYTVTDLVSSWKGGSISAVPDNKHISIDIYNETIPTDDGTYPSKKEVLIDCEAKTFIIRDYK